MRVTSSQRKQMGEEEQMIDSFTTADEISDVTLIVEEKKIFAHKSILAKVSPVFGRMLFSSGFRESRTSEINLPGKQYLHIVELLKCVYPNILKPIDNVNATYLLPLSDEYSILILRKNIERFLISSTTNIASYKYGDNQTRLFDLLALAQLYRLNKLEEHICEQLTSHFDMGQWNKPELPIKLRCHLLELFVQKQQAKLKDKQTKLKESEDLCLKQKFEIQRLKSQLESTVQ
ncbi:unnamed protein product [Adineta ricciae]|uniref:BTB domain-containing protein n=1 Tax=Adineta ricciae TaxID=249248 RepID=A0A815LX14_ADIRI|nr:unnamed protein product [Adineta ricciae]